MQARKGSGKSYVVARTTKMFGMRVVNSDDVFEKLVKTKSNMNMDMRNYSGKEKRRDELRDIAKRVTKWVTERKTMSKED